MTYRYWYAALAAAFVLTAGCGSEGTDDTQLPLGAECTDHADCEDECLPQFAGGYCGVVGCTGDADCPSDAACILHIDAVPYCFRLCESTPDCNTERVGDHEALCSDNIVFVDDAQNRRACIPPAR